MVRRESLLQAAGTPAPFCPSVRLLVSVVCFSCMCLLFSINIDTNCSMNPETWNYSHVYSHMGNFTNTDIKVCNNSATNLGHIGELMVQLPAGWLSWRYGGKKVFVTCIATASVVALLTPTAIVESMHFVMTCSFLLGMCQGASWPAALTLLATWSPPLELSRLAAVIFSGQWIGILVSVSTTTASSHTSHQYWPNIFYIEGAIGSALVLFTAFLVHDVPSSHHLISGLERDYISRARMNIQTGESKTLPLQRILTSLPVWAIFIAHISSIWGRYVIFSAMTTYLSQVLHINQSQDLLMVKLTHAGVVIVMLVTAVIADRLRHSCLSTTSTRKLFTVIGEFLPAICLMVGGFSQSSESTFPSVLFVLGGCLVGCSYGSGYIVNVVDIASDYVPVVFAISNTIAVSIRLLGPLAVSNIADDMDQSSWQIIFVITAIVGLFGGLFYMVFGSGQDQFLSHEHREHAHCANQHTAINRAPQVLL